MIQAQDIILALRSRLRDEGVEKVNSDNELIDFINMAYIALATRLKLFIGHMQFSLPQKQLLLGRDVIALVNVAFDGRNIDIVPLIYLLKNKSNIPLSATLKDNTLLLSKEIEHGVLEVDFTYIKKIALLDDFLDLGEYYKEAIVFYCMFLALQKEPRIDSIQKAQYYQNLYEMEAQKIAILNSESTAQTILSEYQRV